MLMVGGLTVVVSDIPEHRALLGDEYPYYVPLDTADEDASVVIKRAWDHSSDGDIYAHAHEVLSAMTSDRVAAAYVDMFIRVRNRG